MHRKEVTKDEFTASRITQTAFAFVAPRQRNSAGLLVELYIDSNGDELGRIEWRDPSGSDAKYYLME